MRELRFQKLLSELLATHLKRMDPQASVWYGNQFKNITARWNKKPDLLLQSAKLPFKTIGIECKTGMSLKGISQGIIHQVQGKYFNQKYLIRKTKETVELDAMCFTTEIAIKKGYFYENHYPEASRFYIERIINEMNYSNNKFGYLSLTFNQKDFLFYFKNLRLKLNGEHQKILGYRD